MRKASLLRSAKWGFILVLLLAFAAGALGYKPIIPDPNSSHDRWGTRPRDIIREFRAYTTSFDSKDGGIVYGIPEWVAYEIKPCREFLGEAPAGPGAWMTDSTTGLAPTDESYSNSTYDRGYMCQKFIAWRLGANACWNTHTTLNACPQSPSFSRGIWGDLDKEMAAWADVYKKSVWIICGPVILKDRAVQWIGDAGEVRVAVPHAFFKIVIRESRDPERPHVLAFLYPHHHFYSEEGPYDHTPYLVSVDDIEELTGLDFLTALPDDIEEVVESTVATGLWTVW